MTEIIWQDPTPSQRKAIVFTDELRSALRDSPGRWAVVCDRPSSGHTGVMKSRYGADGFEFTTRTIQGDPKTYRTYARFNPESVSA